MRPPAVIAKGLGSPQPVFARRPRAEPAIQTVFWMAQRCARNDGVKISPDLWLSYSVMTFRAALILALATTPAFAQEAVDCGACTDLDRASMAEPILPAPLPLAPKPVSTPDRGQAFEIPGVSVPPVYYKPGAGLWVSDVTPGGVFLKPKKDKFSIDMRF